MKLITFSPVMSATIPVIVAFSFAAFLILIFNLPQYSIAFFLGVIAGGLVDMDNHTSGRVQNMIVMLIGFTLSASAVGLSRGHDILRPVLMSFIAFGSIFTGAVDQRYRTLAFGMLTIAIYATLIEQSGSVWYLSTLAMLLGAILYQLITLSYHVLFPNRPVQEGLINSYQALGEVFNIKAAYFDPDENAMLATWQKQLNQKNQRLITFFNQCRDALFVRISNLPHRPKTQKQLSCYFIAQDIHERVNSSHVDYEELTHNFEHSDLLYRIKDLINLQGEACALMVKHLQNDTPFVFPSRLKRKTYGLLSSFEQKKPHEIQRLIENLIGINDQLQKLAHLDTDTSAIFSDSRIFTYAAYSWRQALLTLKRNFSFQSIYFRHALRIAVVTLPISLVVEYLKLPLGYWILLTVVFVCQPNYAATQDKIRQRIIGTLLGVLVGSFLPLLIPSLISKLAVIVLTCILFFYYRFQHYGYSTYFITVQVFVGLSIIGVKTAEAAPMRIVDTLIGAAISYGAVTLLWADQHYQTIKGYLSAALIAASDYLQIYVEQQEKQRDNLPYRAARRQLYESAAGLAQYSNDLASLPKKDLTELEQARNLTDCNYRLLADLSALGAHRQEKLPEQTENIIYLLGQQFFELYDLKEIDQKKQSEKIKTLISNLPDQSLYLKKQLSRIEKRQTEMYQLMKK